MPASRSAAATTLAPRSWPSRPGLATSTRMGRIERLSGGLMSVAGGSSRTRAPKLAVARAGRQLAPHSALPCDEQHPARPTTERTVQPAVVRLLDDEPRIGAELGEACRRVQPDPVRPLAAAMFARPTRLDGEYARERVEAALLTNHRAVARHPPVTREE